ncbi:hypothetical protein LB505_011560 [Fusarium chuoi]|nr:hypothetical protein LB505_011560 [Fusarium chuoi]
MVAETVVPDRVPEDTLQPRYDETAQHRYDEKEPHFDTDLKSEADSEDDRITDLFSSFPPAKGVEHEPNPLTVRAVVVDWFHFPRYHVRRHLRLWLHPHVDKVPPSRPHPRRQIRSPRELHHPGRCHWRRWHVRCLRRRSPRHVPSRPPLRRPQEGLWSHPHHHLRLRLLRPLRCCSPPTILHHQRR